MANQTSKALWVYLSRTSKMTKSKARIFFLHFWSKQKWGVTSLPLLTAQAIVESTHENNVGFTSTAAIFIVPLLGTTFFALCRDICRLNFLSVRSKWLYNVFFCILEFEANNVKQWSIQQIKIRWAGFGKCFASSALPLNLVECSLVFGHLVGLPSVDLLVCLKTICSVRLWSICSLMWSSTNDQFLSSFSSRSGSTASFWERTISPNIWSSTHMILIIPWFRW